MTKLINKLILISLLILPFGAISQEFEEENEEEAIVRLIESAKLFEGVKYGYGSSKDTKTDCSGLLRQIFFSIGIELPRSSHAQAQDERFVEVPFALRQAGDVLFFKNTYKKGISHVALLIDKDTMIHASYSKRRVVLEKITTSNRLMKKFHKLKRFRFVSPEFNLSTKS